MSEESGRWATATEAALTLRLTPERVRRRVASGQLPGFVRDGHFWIDRIALANLVSGGSGALDAIGEERFHAREDGPEAA